MRKLYLFYSKNLNVQWWPIPKMPR